MFYPAMKNSSKTCVRNNVQLLNNLKHHWHKASLCQFDQPPCITRTAIPQLLSDKLKPPWNSPNLEKTIGIFELEEAPAESTKHPIWTCQDHYQYSHSYKVWKPTQEGLILTGKLSQKHPQEKKAGDEADPCFCFWKRHAQKVQGKVWPQQTLLSHIPWWSAAAEGQLSLSLQHCLLCDSPQHLGAELSPPQCVLTDQVWQSFQSKELKQRS